MNPWLIVGLLIAYGASVAGVGLAAFDLGQDRQKASQAEKQALVAEAVDAAMATTASAIAGIEIKHQTIRQEIQREIRTNTVYADCRHSAGGLRSVNDALAGPGPGPAGSGELPIAADPAGRQLRGDNGNAGGSRRDVPQVPRGGAQSKQVETKAPIRSTP